MEEMKQQAENINKVKKSLPDHLTQIKAVTEQFEEKSRKVKFREKI